MLVYSKRGSKSRNGNDSKEAEMGTKMSGTRSKRDDVLGRRSCMLIMLYLHLHQISEDEQEEQGMILCHARVRYVSLEQKEKQEEQWHCG